MHTICQHQRCRSVCASVQSYQLLIVHKLDSKISRHYLVFVPMQACSGLKWSETCEDKFSPDKVD